MNWDLCLLCHKGGEQLVDPNSNNKASVCGYEKLACNINNFVEAGLIFPKKVKVSLDDLNANYDIATNPRNKKAKWHQYCSIEFSALRFSDIVWNRYFANSLKKTTRDISGSGIRLKVTSNGRLPKDWKSFLRCDENKKELFPFLANRIIGKIQSSNILVATGNDIRLCNRGIDISELMPCSNEEADLRLFLHARHASENCNTLLIKTVDSDVVVIAAYAFQQLHF